ncbi:class I SAM-dependent methyltransferase [Luteipulveratus sp. YIM 133132]|uniref:class I SAM-dependent methyltransferase n=1 Tax=Luteipulveratus flavus TaxID=3031728 RepID=UPI0023B0C74E|nr:class I SAM-dependent methyltransferase [Luteipulveratus sp. YIM 133132]MDE9366395.1 class I SAM-dependent methyltransferase [Luteipulveratus sp. YIM 133132]
MTSDQDIERWDSVADAYARLIGQPEDSFFRRVDPSLRAAIGDAAGKRILDVGCGHGWLARRFVAEGASLVGVDGSRSLIDKARAAEPDATWIVHDLDEGLPDNLGEFDVAIAHMVLMDIPELEPLLTDVHGALSSGGVFVASILHPSFFNQEPVEDNQGARYRKVTEYLSPQRWWINTFGGHWHYHRPLESYTQALLKAGFVITGLAEPRTLPNSPILEHEWDSYQRWFAQIPTMLTIEARPATLAR